MKVRFGAEKSLYKRAFLIRQPTCLLIYKWLDKIIHTYTGQVHKNEFLLLSYAELIEWMSNQLHSIRPHTSPTKHPAELGSHRL